jgi:hypothetical protein
MTTDDGLIRKGSIIHFRPSEDVEFKDAVVTAVDVSPGVIVIRYLVDPEDEEMEKSNEVAFGTS